MTKQEILEKFNDIDFVYNDSSKHETLSRMLDELLKEQEKSRLEMASEITQGSILMYQGKEIVRCKDCKHGQYEEWDNGECTDKTVYCDGYGIHKPDWFCADGVRKDS